jgi:pimeloyl-ACP methyl ester carboxylesterase
MARRRGSIWCVAGLCLWATACRADSFAAPLSRFFAANGVRLHYLVQGAGEPVVLIHGLYASAEINWQRPRTLALLAKHHQVLALDLPGHGRSDKPATADAYGRQMVEDVILLLDHLRIRAAHVVGYSMGGMVALKLIAEHPDRVLSGTLGGMGWLQEGSVLQRIWERLPARRQGLTPGVCATSAGQLALTRAELTAIEVPVAVVVGDRDPVRELYVAPLRTVRQDWPVIQIRGAGHLNCILKPDFREAIARWVDAHRLPGR